jgi:hypothetical protein
MISLLVLEIAMLVAVAAAIGDCSRWNMGTTWPCALHPTPSDPLPGRICLEQLNECYFRVLAARWHLESGSA